MDRIDAMAVFVAVVDEGSLAAAARRLGRTPVAATRAVALLERQTGARLLHRTTRMLRLTEAGERYAAVCRRVLAELEQAALLAAGERSVPRGTLTVTAPALFGRLHVRPLVSAFLDDHPAVQVRLLLLDRVVNLIEEGIDVALRIGHLPDSELIAIRCGQVRRVACASPKYLSRRPSLREPADLATHDCIAFSQIATTDLWTFAPGPKGKAPKRVRVQPRLIVNGAEAAIAAVLEGRGVTCVFSYQVERELRAGRLVRVLKPFEPPPVPVHLVYTQSRAAIAKTRAFVDFAAPALRAVLARIEETSSRRS